VRAFQRAIGISEAEIIELLHIRDREQLRPDPEMRLRRTDIELQQPDPTDLDDLLAAGLDKLVSRVDPAWLRAEALKPYRLGAAFLNNPLHLVNGVRVGTNLEANTAQRFAQMLLVSQDRLANRPDTDFFAAAMFLPEVAVLGNSLGEIKALGPEAEHKLAALPSMADDQVSSTIYELLVGAAGIRKGLNLTMVPENRSRKVPDFQVSGLGPIPGAIECKRRLGLTLYEHDEASRVEALYNSVRPLLRERGVHGAIETTFGVPLSSVPSGAFSEAVFAAIKSGHPETSISTDWGTVRFSPLPHRRSIFEAPLYSPDYLVQVFGWNPLQDEWDGILAEVEAPMEITTELFTMPLCLKWRNEADEALKRKARGITSLWGDAIKQIPDGDVGFVYIAYPEGSRPAVADARTDYIMKTMPDVFHRWSVRVPATIVNRLYPRPLGRGRPDIIENVMLIASQGEEHWLKRLPARVFTGELGH